MKVKELPNQDASLSSVRVIIPDTISDYELNLIGLTQRDVYVVSCWGYGTPDSSGIWLKKTPTDTHVFPLSGHEGKEVLDWDVWEEGINVAYVDPCATMRRDNAEKMEGDASG